MSELPELWRTMQLVERNRHAAELLEARAAKARRESGMWLAIARQRRELAEQVNRLSSEKPLNDLSPLSPLD